MILTGRKLFLLFIILFFTTCGFGAKEELITSTNHLRTSARIEYYLNKEASDLTEITVRETFDQWSEATHFEFAYKGRNRAGLLKDGKNTVSFLLKWPPEVAMKHVAYCQNWFDKEGNIVESDIIFNMAIARFTTRRTRKPDSYYLEGLLSHEIGHMIGLSHLPADNENEALRSRSPQAPVRMGLASCVMEPLLTIQDSATFDGPDPQTIQAYRELYKAFLR